jgi:hypothetical protein
VAGELARVHAGAMEYSPQVTRPITRPVVDKVGRILRSNMNTETVGAHVSPALLAQGTRVRRADMVVIMRIRDPVGMLALPEGTLTVASADGEVRSMRSSVHKDVLIRSEGVAAGPLIVFDRQTAEHGRNGVAVWTRGSQLRRSSFKDHSGTVPRDKRRLPIRGRIRRTDSDGQTLAKAAREGRRRPQEGLFPGPGPETTMTPIFGATVRT